MRYRLTCLTPVLVGDGNKLSPIDYMVWKDQVNVLDQKRIFKLLSKGPRLDGYLVQIRKAEKLDFASWGGFAQNYADRRVSFEHPSIAKAWEQARGETLSIPTFASATGGPYLPGSALKGALRTGMLFARWSDSPPHVEVQSERPSSRSGEAAEDNALGTGGASVMRAIKVGDSGPRANDTMRLYLLRTSALVPRGGGRFDLGWKQAPKGTVQRAEDGTPMFAEMAAPGTVFEGAWKENAFLANPEVVRALRWRGPVNSASIFEAANAYAARLIAIHQRYAEQAGLAVLRRSLDEVSARLEAVRGAGCIVSMGWGSGLLAKTGWLETDSEAQRQVLRNIPFFTRAIESGLPFPKTRRIVFLNGEPAALPGWAELRLE
ncbi:MAG TPA: type III-A CRISPR-associated RAMP protein Csm5 [Bryobacteraceae bacterium]|nr:type III-A CRISPR-associated RAMP protein Csm5 [Bryobacteraceae bacterium]